jgi:C4-type Zn-finger protein
MGILRDVYRVVAGLKRKKLGKQHATLCPRCGSPQLKRASSLNTYPRMYGLAPLSYVCADCGYKGPIVLELEEEESRG